MKIWPSAGFRASLPSTPFRMAMDIVIRAAEGENGELCIRLGDRCLPAFRCLKDLQIQYIVALRERGAVYYAASMDGAHGLAATPNMRPIAVDPYDDTPIIYAGVFQSVLGQIGFRADTRVRHLKVRSIPELTGGDHVLFSDRLITGGTLRAGWTNHVGDISISHLGAAARSQKAFATIGVSGPIGLIHANVRLAADSGSVGLAWRIRDARNYMLITLSAQGCSLDRVSNGDTIRILTDQLKSLVPGNTHSFQILDGHGTLSAYLDGDILFDRWVDEPDATPANGIGIAFSGAGAAGCAIWRRILGRYRSPTRSGKSRHGTGWANRY